MLLAFDQLGSGYLAAVGQWVAKHSWFETSALRRLRVTEEDRPVRFGRSFICAAVKTLSTLSPEESE